MDIRYDELKKICGKIIKDNLDTDRLLNIDDFKEYEAELKRLSKGLKFYKYYRPDKHYTDDFKNNILSCCNPIQFNDIFEGMVSSYDLADSKRVREIIDTVCDSVRISCFSETWDNLLMYAHYTDSFKGFCLEYDLQYICERFPNHKLFYPVLYTDKPCVLSKMLDLEKTVKEEMKIDKLGTMSGGSGSHNIDDVISYFIHKANIWEYEKEWRIILPIPYTHSINYAKGYRGRINMIDFDCVTAVYYAAAIDHECRKDLADIVRNKNEERSKDTKRSRPHIHIYETSICPNEYKLNRKLVL